MFPETTDTSKHSGLSIFGINIVLLKLGNLIEGMIMSCALMLLWDEILPVVCGFKTITYWQAFGIWCIIAIPVGRLSFIQISLFKGENE